MASAHDNHLHPAGPDDLAGIVLMAGAVRRTALSRTAGRSRLDLPLREDLTVGACWSRHAEEARAALGLAELPMILCANTAAPPARAAQGWPGVRIAMDREEPRGSGGALRDLSESLPGGARILVASAHTYARGGWAPVLRALAGSAADVAIHTDAAGRPTGAFLVRCSALAGIPARGFIDFKEQAMPQIAARHDVRVVVTRDEPPIPILTLDSYLRAVRDAATPDGAGGPAEDWRRTFGLVEDGAEVHGTARLHDSVVLAGGRVERGAVVVRSLVGPSGVVAAGASAIDVLVGGAEAGR